MEVIAQFLAHLHFCFPFFGGNFLRLCYYWALESLINKTLIGLEYHFCKQLKQEQSVKSLVPEIKSTIFLSVFHLVEQTIKVGLFTSPYWVQAYGLFVLITESVEMASSSRNSSTPQYLGIILSLEILPVSLESLRPLHLRFPHSILSPP